ncbi:MAG: hypothetical protein EAZ24_11895, partial [Burkholderiales bacterium]
AARSPGNLVSRHAGAFVPLFFGVFWKRANSAGAAASIFFGLMTWIGAELKWYPTSIAGTDVPPQFFGLFAAIAAMVIVSISTEKMLPSKHHEAIPSR